MSVATDRFPIFNTAPKILRQKAELLLGALLRSAAVPIYEYVCMECESHFEELVRGEQQVACPDCAGTNVSRQFSSFAVHGVAKPVTTGGGGGGCCGGSCGCGH